MHFISTNGHKFYVALSMTPSIITYTVANHVFSLYHFTDDSCVSVVS